jgi:glycosyltransferase involved in cell wall biosynthesis
MNKRMSIRFSIITVVYNRKATIERTVQSVLEQDYPNIEYIVIDGGSTDGSVDVVNKYSASIDVFISEPDGGMYDALNKGIRLATGDVIGILHSDDVFANANIVTLIANHFLQSNIDGMYADVAFVRAGVPNKVIRYVRSAKFSIKKFKFGFMPAHPTFFCKKKIFETHGFYRTDLEIAADFDLMVRFLQEKNINVSYLPLLVTKMNLGGKSTSGVRSTLTINKEINKILKEKKISSSYIYLYSRYLVKIYEFFKTS